MAPTVICTLNILGTSQGKLVVTKMKVERLDDLDRSVLFLSEAAAFLKCDPRTLSKELKKGTVSHFTIGRRVYIPVATFRALLEGANRGKA